MTVRYDQREVSYDYADLNEVTLAWAIAIHKSQGSEYPVVILPMFTQHYMMLRCNLPDPCQEIGIAGGAEEGSGHCCESSVRSPEIHPAKPLDSRREHGEIDNFHVIDTPLSIAQTLSWQ